MNMPDPSPPPPALVELFCTQCGYSLYGLPRPVCPECGEDATAYVSGQPQVDWLRVKGWLHPAAFWKTVFAISFRDPGRLRFELLRDVDYRHTRTFAWLAAFFGWLALPLAWVTIALLIPKSACATLPEKPGFWLYAGCAAIVTLVWMLALSGLHTYFFHPRKLPVAIQNRTLALSYLAAAPLALLPVLLLGIIVCVAFIPDRYEVYQVLTVLMLPTAALLLWYRRIVSFAAPLLHDPARGWMLALLWPVAAALLSILLLVVVPLIGFYIAIVIVSLKELV